MTYRIKMVSLIPVLGVIAMLGIIMIVCGIQEIGYGGLSAAAGQWLVGFGIITIAISLGGVHGNLEKVK